MSHNTIEPSQRITGYLYQFNGNEHKAPIESWHRTLKGALEAQKSHGLIGSVYRLQGDLSFKVN